MSVIGKASAEGRGSVRSGLGPEAYTCQSAFEDEVRRIFAPAWRHVAFTHELASPGDVLPLELAGMPIVLVRDHLGAIRCFHNVCRHRGTLLVPEPCAGRAVITCRYHGWAYGLDGGLRSTPYFGGGRDELPDGFAKSEHSLIPVACAVWHGWIFVNLDGNARPFGDYVAPLAGRVAHVPFSRLRHLATLDLGVVKANWKLIMENSLENYHVPFVHATTAVQPLEDHFDVIDGACLGTGVEVPGSPSRPTGAGAPTSLDMSALYLGLWPTFIMAAYEPATIVTHLNLPLAPDRTRRKVALFTTAETAPDAATIEGWRNLAMKVAAEDVAVFEAQQRGRASPAGADGGVLSPRWELVVAAFQSRVIEALA